MSQALTVSFFQVELGRGSSLVGSVNQFSSPGDQMDSFATQLRLSTRSIGCKLSAHKCQGEKHRQNVSNSFTDAIPCSAKSPRPFALSLDRCSAMPESI